MHQDLDRRRSIRTLSFGDNHHSKPRTTETDHPIETQDDDGNEKQNRKGRLSFLSLLFWKTQSNNNSNNNKKKKMTMMQRQDTPKELEAVAKGSPQEQENEDSLLLSRACVEMSLFRDDDQENDAESSEEEPQESEEIFSSSSSSSEDDADGGNSDEDLRLVEEASVDLKQQPQPLTIKDKMLMAIMRMKSRDDPHQRERRLARQMRRRQPFKERFTKEVDVDQYMASRAMSTLQERMNAITMIPSPAFCIYYILSGSWVQQAAVVAMQHQDAHTEESKIGLSALANHLLGDAHGCLTTTGSSWFSHSMPALPPLPLLAVAIGICLHAPFSMLYHWKYAVTLPSGFARTTHWSRRMDHAMIHFCSACMSYATSGSWQFFYANALFNADCIYRQFQPKVRPRSNKIRVFISILAYTIPIIKRGDAMLFAQVWAILLLSFFLFAAYPIGGWSHSAFHLVIALAPPLVMNAALELPASQGQLRLAAECLAAAGTTTSTQSEFIISM